MVLLSLRHCYPVIVTAGRDKPLLNNLWFIKCKSVKKKKTLKHSTVILSSTSPEKRSVCMKTELLQNVRVMTTWFSTAIMSKAKSQNWGGVHQMTITYVMSTPTSCLRNILTQATSETKADRNEKHNLCISAFPLMQNVHHSKMLSWITGEDELEDS